jgi:HD-GYP domain-containing protein (c-di-GMP phosphodiesterase class II)
MLKEIHVSLFDMIMCLSSALDLVSPSVVNHHKRVALIASSIASEVDLPIEDQRNIIMAGLIHDLGAITLQEKLKIKHYNLESTQSHAELGYILIRLFRPFEKLAPLVRYHHVPWNNGKGKQYQDKKVPLGAHILHLADRIEVLIDRDKHILGQPDLIIDRIANDSGKKFIPKLVEAFKRMAKREFFWLDCLSPKIDEILLRNSKLEKVELDLDQLQNLARLFSQIVDFRSRFTATHSTGVSASAEALAGMMGLSDRDCKLMRVSGYLHDLGKLAVPSEILDKTAALTSEELHIIRTHTYHTFRILSHVDELYDISIWGALHHERLDGSGYPFHYKGEEMPLPSRIMAVADVFTATTEDRPYRAGMGKEAVMDVLKNLSNNGLLEPDIVTKARDNFDELDIARTKAQEEADKDYAEFWQKLTELMMAD